MVVSAFVAEISDTFFPPNPNIQFEKSRQTNTTFKFEPQFFKQPLSLPPPLVESRIGKRVRRSEEGMSIVAPPTPPYAMNTAGGAAIADLKTVLITGVSRGLGKALALELAKRGHTVIGCSRSPEKLSSLQSELASASENKSNSNKHLIMNVDVVIYSILYTRHLSNFLLFNFICP